MNQQEATEFVIRELGKHHQRNDIIQKLCETGGMNWSQAEKFLQTVESQNQSSIARRQSPLVAVIGVFTVIIGLGIALFTVYETLQGAIYFLLALPIPYLGNIILFLTGLGMVAGGIRGMWDTIVRIWDS